MANDNKTKLEKAIERVNSIKFQISLWQNVKLVVEEDGTKKAINGEYIDDPLFPILRVSGYNELNKQEETHTLYCYMIISDWSRNDWIAEYEETGDTPAYSFPAGTESLIFCQIRDLQAELRSAEEELKMEKKLAEQPKDTATYYLLGESLVGKRKKNKDFLFLENKWTPDEEGLIEKQFDSITEIERGKAMELITDQTIASMMEEWVEKYAKAKTIWDRNPQWFSKLVSISFVLNGIKKTIYPDDFLFEDGKPEEAFIEYISEELSEDIRRVGGYVTGIGGMPD